MLGGIFMETENRQYEIISDKYKLQDEKAYISFS